MGVLGWPLAKKDINLLNDGTDEVNRAWRLRGQEAGYSGKGCLYHQKLTGPLLSAFATTALLSSVRIVRTHCFMDE